MQRPRNYNRWLDDKNNTSEPFIAASYIRPSVHDNCNGNELVSLD